MATLDTATQLNLTNTTTLGNRGTGRLWNGTISVTGINTTYVHPITLNREILAVTYINITSTLNYPIFLTSSFFKAISNNPNMSSVQVYELLNISGSTGWYSMDSYPVVINTGMNIFKVTGNVRPDTIYNWSFGFSTAYAVRPDWTSLYGKQVREGNSAIGPAILYNYNINRISSLPITTIVVDPVWDGSTTCTNNWVGGACHGSITYTTSTALTNDVNASTDIVINSGVTVVTNGYSMFTGNMIHNLGTINAGTAGNGGATTGGTGGSFTSSYAGSGGQGGSGGAHATSGGNGATPSAPVVDNANILTWYGGGFTNYLSGAGGGGGGSGGTDTGGAGSNGVYLQAGTVLAGPIVANGLAGSTTTSTSGTTGGNGGATLASGGTGGVGGGKPGSDGGGGGGGGAIIIAYGTTYTAGTYTVTGGAGAGTSPSNGGNGGNGQTSVFHYTTQPLPTVPNSKALLVLNPSPASVTNSVINNGGYTTLNTIVSNGIAPYKGNWIWSAPNTLTSLSVSNTIIANILSGGAANSVITVNAYSTTNVIFTFNGVNYYANVLGTNTIYGTWTFTGNYVDSHAYGAIAGLASTTITITAVQNTCTFTTSNAAINFGSISTGTNTIGTSGSYNVITATDTGSNPTNILISGSNWNYNANSFDVHNTIWSTVHSNTLWGPLLPIGANVNSANVVSANVEIDISGSSVDTLQYVAAGGTNTIWFGVAVPSGQAGSGSGTYAQTINIISSC